MKTILLVLLMFAQGASAAPAPTSIPSAPDIIHIVGEFTGRVKWINGELFEEFVLQDGTVLWVIAVEE